MIVFTYNYEEVVTVTGQAWIKTGINYAKTAGF